MNVGIGGCAPPQPTITKKPKLIQLIGRCLLFVKQYQNTTKSCFISYTSALAETGSNRG